MTSTPTYITRAAQGLLRDLRAKGQHAESIDDAIQQGLLTDLDWADALDAYRPPTAAPARPAILRPETAPARDASSRLRPGRLPHRFLTAADDTPRTTKDLLARAETMCGLLDFSPQAYSEATAGLVRAGYLRITGTRTGRGGHQPLHVITPEGRALLATLGEP